MRCMARPSKVLKAFGERLRLLRKARGWTQEELARRTERHWTYIGGLERGERNPTLVVLCDLAVALGVRPYDLLDEGHPLLGKLNSTAGDVFDAIDKGFRAQIDVKGKLAELYMSRQLERLRASNIIEAFTWQDVDGKPDFVVTYRGHALAVECKNIRNEVFRHPPSYKVELQRTRNSMDGTPTRGYKADEFDVLGVALFNQTGRWDFLYVATRYLERRASMPGYLAIMQRVPMVPNDTWTPEALRALDDAVGGR
jgi:transcriptional regulator with XRE-family HTH domain